MRDNKNAAVDADQNLIAISQVLGMRQIAILRCSVISLWAKDKSTLRVNRQIRPAVICNVGL
jgi:hypothetical protein